MAETTDIASAGKQVRGLAAFKGFLGEVKAEMLKCNWPTRGELREQTIVVIISVLLLAFVIWFSDTLLMAVMSVIFR